MNRLVRGSVILAAAAVSWACGGLDTDGIDETVELIADPGVVYVANTDSQAVFVEALNNLGQQLEGDFTVTNVGPGINVNYDTTFAPRPGVENLPTRVRYFVRATDPTSFVNSSFEVTANGVSVVIPVRITLANLAISLSNATPGLGEAVTLTAPANVRFTPASAVTVGGGVAVVIGLSADSTQLTLLFSPNITAQTLTVSNVIVTYLSPTQLFTIPTTGTVTTPVLTQFTSVFDDVTPDVNQNVTLTAAGFKFLPGNTFVYFGNDLQTAISFAADSSSVTFRAHKPGASGTVSVQGIIISNLPQVPLLLNATTTVTVSNTVLTLPGADAFATAPEIQIPPTGKTGGVVDNGVWFTGPASCSASLGGPCRIYKIVLPVARTFTINASWDNTADVGVYRAVLAGTVTNIGCDIHGPAPGQFETCTITGLAAGTYFLIVDDFSPFYGPPDDVPPGSITMDLVGG